MKRVKELWSFLKLLWEIRSTAELQILLKIHRLMLSQLFFRAKEAVNTIAQNGSLCELGQKEGQVSYCPRCGQRPEYDVRHDEAFEFAHGRLAPRDRSLELHFAIELATWVKKHGR